MAGVASLEGNEKARVGCWQGEWLGRLITMPQNAERPGSSPQDDHAPAETATEAHPMLDTLNLHTRVGDGGKSMTTFQSIALGMMIIWTPSFFFVAIFLRHAPVVRERHRSDQELSRERRSPNLQAEDTTIQPSGVDVEQISSNFKTTLRQSAAKEAAVERLPMKSGRPAKP
jgi:hypothetical protein